MWIKFAFQCVIIALIMHMVFSVSSVMGIHLFGNELFHTSIGFFITVVWIFAQLGVTK